MPSDEDFDFPSPPEDFLGYQANRVVSIIDDPAGVQGAIDDLTKNGVSSADISVLAGTGGASTIDIDGDHHGLRGRIYRFVEKLGDEHQWLQRHAELLQGGAFGLAVAAAPEEKSEVAKIISDHGGHDTAFFGNATWEEM